MAAAQPGAGIRLLGVHSWEQGTPGYWPSLLMTLDLGNLIGGSQLLPVLWPYWV